MLAIDYPSDLESFKSDYLSMFGQDFLDSLQVAYDTLCDSDNLSSLRGVYIEDILTGEFNFLLDLGIKYRTTRITDEQETEFKRLFNYDMAGISPKKQPNIAKFFVNKSADLKICTCYFCNIDFINAFSDGADYINFEEFITNAPVSDLAKIYGVSENLAQDIDEYRNSLGQGEDISDGGLTAISGIGPARLSALKTMEFKEEYYHFTLDHILNKALYPILSLSLFNLLPSCYACNSKFKGEKPLVTSMADEFLSPTSELFSFHDDNTFQLFFKANKNTTSYIRSINDFSLRLISSKEPDKYNTYIEMFKLNARYKSHKSDVLDLIIKRKKYTDTKLSQIARLVGGNATTVKTSLFGHEIFESNLSKKPKTKLLQDIAKSIKLIN